MTHYAFAADKVTTVSTNADFDIADDGSFSLAVDGQVYSFGADVGHALAQAIIPAATAEDADGNPVPTGDDGVPVLPSVDTDPAGASDPTPPVTGDPVVVTPDPTVTAGDDTADTNSDTSSTDSSASSSDTSDPTPIATSLTQASQAQ